MLVRRLLLNTMRRMWGIYLAVGLLIAAMSWIARIASRDGDDLGSMADVLAVSMACAWFCGFMSATVLEQREIVRLPVSRREFWLARWWFCVVVPPVATTVFASVAVFFHPGVTAQIVALNLGYSALYGGCFMALTAVVPLKQRTTPAWSRDLVILVYFGLTISGVYLPFRFTSYLPHAFSALGGPMLPMLIAAVGVTIASYFYQPPIVTHAGRPHWAKAKPRTGVARSTRPRLTGLTLMAWRETTRTVLILMATVPVVFAFERFSNAGLTVTEFLRNGRALPFEGPFPELHSGAPLMMFFFIAGMPSGFNFIGDLRRMRIFPWSTSRLAATLTVFGVLFAVSVWIFLLILHAFVVRTWPATLRLNWFLAVSGGIAMIQTMQLIVPPRLNMVSLVAIIPLTVIALEATGTTDSITATVVGAAGATMLVGSFLINRWAVKSRSSIYKKRNATLPFVGGVPDPNQL